MDAVTECDGREHDDGGTAKALVLRIAECAQQFARERIPDRDAAEDLAHDVVLEAMKMIESGRLRDDGTPVAGLVHRMVQCRQTDAYRSYCQRRKRERLHAGEVAVSTHVWMQADASAEEGELLEAYRSALAALPDRCRRAFLMVREEERTYQITAQQLDVARSTVIQYVATADALCRQRLVRAGLAAAAVKGGAR